jgi:hypothetical protein
MKPRTPTVPRWIAALACGLAAASYPASLAQTAPPAATSGVSAATLAKYDKNQNGVLDANELTAMQADEAKAAATPVVTTPGTAPAPAAPASDEVIALSPFEVSESPDKGYAAQNTLAGTRLNSRLEDISASISVVTKQQLQDTAAIDINDIFSYEIGTEGTKQYTDLTTDGRGDYDNVSGNPNEANRMRGLSMANIAVGGFTASSSLPIDTYNIDSVEISRGPNSNLAGLSDAGGTVNIVTSRGNVTRESTRLEARVDNLGGYRASIDLNRPIIRNKLGVRFSAVYNETAFVRKPSVDRTTRQQIAVTVKPFSKTTISGSIEFMNEFAKRANSMTPRDTITAWRRNGQPTWDAQPGNVTYTVNGVRSAPVTALPSGIGISGLGSSNARILQFIDDGNIQYLMRGSATTNATLGTNSGLQQFTQSSADPVQGGGLFKIPATTDKSIYDWEKVNLAAPNYERQKANSINVTLDQAILTTQRQRLDLNIAWRREDQYRYQRQFIAQQDGVGNTLEVDTNARLIDGRPNPFFMHPFIGGVNPQVYKRPSFSDAYRGQLAYQLDLRREPSLLKWLGMHRALGYGEYTMSKQNGNGLRYHDMVVDNPDFLGTAITNPTPTTNVTGSAGALFYPLYYFGKTPGGGVEYANTGPVNPNGKFLASYLSSTATAWNLADPVTVDEIYFSLQQQQKKKVRTVGFTLQSYFLKDTVVTTFGKRHDRNYTSDAFAPTLQGGFYDLTNLTNYGANKRWRFGDTMQKGVVVRPFREIPFVKRLAEGGTGLGGFFGDTLRGFSFHLNQSESFRPADTLYDLFLRELPNPSSSGREWGFGLTMFDDKLNLRVTHHQTQQLNARATTSTFATRALGIDFHPGGQTLSFNLYDAATNWMTLLHPNYTPQQAQDAAAVLIGYEPGYVQRAANMSIGDISDALSRGWEVELQFNPNRYLTVRVGGSQGEAIDQNISQTIQQFIELRMPTWTTMRIPSDPLPDGTFLPNAGLLWWNISQGSQGVPATYYNNNVRNALLPIIANQGKRKPQNREYTLNVVTNYRLGGLGAIAESHRWLRNTSVGGSLRWSSKAAIGYYGAAPDPDGLIRTLDKNRPVFDKPVATINLTFGYDTRFFRDRIRTHFQLNVQNVTESGHLQGVAVNPDGTFNQYRIIDPRQFIFTTRFDL